MWILEVFWYKVPFEKKNSKCEMSNQDDSLVARQKFSKSVTMHNKGKVSLLKKIMDGIVDI